MSAIESSPDWCHPIDDVSLQEEFFHCPGNDLFDFIFDNLSPIPLSLLNNLLIYKLNDLKDLIPKISSEILTESENDEDVERLSKIVANKLNSHHLELLSQKFHDFIMNNCCLATVTKELIDNIMLGQVITFDSLSNLFWLLGNDNVNLQFVDECVQIPNFFTYLIEFLPNENLLEEVALILISLNFDLTCFDMHTLYIRYGYNNLFEIMCHFDFVMADISKESIDVIASFIIDPLMTFDRFLRHENQLFYSIDLEFLGEFTAFVGVFNKFVFVLDCHDPDRFYREVSDQLPIFPSLVELARNCVRDFFVRYYQITKCCQYHTLVRNLPIPKVCQDILTFKRKLY